MVPGKQLMMKKLRRSRKGAWIEILKNLLAAAGIPGRSRKGAWIEMVPGKQLMMKKLRRSRKGAWIEILKNLLAAAGIPGRSRKGAWIEIDNTGYARQVPRVAPVRERGLKLRSEQHYAEWF